MNRNLDHWISAVSSYSLDFVLLSSYSKLLSLLFPSLPFPSTLFHYPILLSCSPLNFMLLCTLLSLSSLIWNCLSFWWQVWVHLEISMCLLWSALDACYPKQWDHADEACKGICRNLKTPWTIALSEVSGWGELELPTSKWVLHLVGLCSLSVCYCCLLGHTSVRF